MIDELKKEVLKTGNPERAKSNAWFFKTGKGQYGEGDKFAGLTVPQSRIIAKKFIDLNLRDIETLLNSPIHEERLISLLILVEQFQKSEDRRKKEIFEFYIKNSEKVNNWDLVDLSAPKIAGSYLSGKQISTMDENKRVLYKFAKSKNLWKKRISIVSTLFFIVKSKEYKDTFRIAEILLQDKHDLIQKAVGWMLREVGKNVSEKELIRFLNDHYKIMPRTMLRYAIERFPLELKMKYMKGLI